MHWFFLFTIACGKPSGGMGIMGSPSDTSSPTSAVGLQFLTGGTFPLGESNGSIVAAYAEEGEHQTIIPVASLTINDFYIDGYPFPGIPGAEWFTDGTRHNTIEALDQTLEQYGRRACTISELMYAAAGPDNNRYPYGNEWIDRVCDPDDANPEPIGTYTGCVSDLGIHDFQVRSSWGRMGERLIAIMSDTTQQQGFPGDLTYAVWGGTSREDTFHAPSNFGFHTHDKLAEDLYLDDGFRVCADGTPTANQDIAYRRWIEDALDAGSYEALFD
jgi:hypothetical protein